MGQRINNKHMNFVGTLLHSFRTLISVIHITLLRSVAVMSMKTFFVLRVIRVWSPVGGREMKQAQSSNRM